MTRYLVLYSDVAGNGPESVSVETVAVLGAAPPSIGCRRCTVRIGHDGTPFEAFEDHLHEDYAAARREAAKHCRQMARRWNAAALQFEKRS